jgi:hypothetical protein
MLRAGTVSVHALARRLRLLALEVFFLGTAMMGALSVLGMGVLGSAGKRDAMRPARPAGTV